MNVDKYFLTNDEILKLVEKEHKDYIFMLTEKVKKLMEEDSK